MVATRRHTVSNNQEANDDDQESAHRLSGACADSGVETQRPPRSRARGDQRSQVGTQCHVAGVGWRRETASYLFTLGSDPRHLHRIAPFFENVNRLRSEGGAFCGTNRGGLNDQDWQVSGLWQGAIQYSYRGCRCNDWVGRCHLFRCDVCLSNAGLPYYPRCRYRSHSLEKRYHNRCRKGAAG